MHNDKLATGRVAIYARYSTDLQNETSIDDQARRAREAIARAGGDPSKALVFPDYAISGGSMQRPGLEALLRAVEEKRVDVVLTEDVSRISRDMGDAAHIFKRLQFAGVPLIGLSDGIDTSMKQGKLTYAFKSMMAEWYVDELRERTLRGLEGRALAGFATGGVPYGFRTEPETDATGRVLGNKIVIDETEAAIIVRIFTMYRDDGAFHRISRALNREGIPSPRAGRGTKHKRFGWGSSTIRAILYNEKYVGVWRFKERQWVKVPGTNKRRPRARAADEVIRTEHPELRIIDAELWTAVQKRLTAVNRKYTKRSNQPENVASPRPVTYLLSGILVCDVCGFPMTIYGGGNLRYYRCSTAFGKGTCSNDLRVREEVLRGDCLEMIREEIQTPEAIEYIRRKIGELLRTYTRDMDKELAERKDRLQRDEDRIKGLVGFIADGDRSEYVVTTLRDLETHAKAERAAIDRLHREAQQPLRLPSLDELTHGAFALDQLLVDQPDKARMMIRRALKEGEIRVGRKPSGYELRFELFPLALLPENANAQVGRVLGQVQSNVSSGGRI